ncbi:MAG: hypothetical protein AAF741_14930 [Bacteroidota bacterium]
MQNTPGDQKIPVKKGYFLLPLFDWGTIDLPFLPVAMVAVSPCLFWRAALRVAFGACLEITLSAALAKFCAVLRCCIGHLAKAKLPLCASFSAKSGGVRSKSNSPASS